jgi:hypothetical protein
LNRTFGTPTNNLKWTWSAWVKRGTLSVATNLLQGYVSASVRTALVLNSNDTIFFNPAVGGLSTTAVFRDPAAWYHIICVYDSANATAGDRFILYVNGTRQTLTGTDLTPSQVEYINSAGNDHYLASGRIGATFYPTDCELAEVNFVDGQALAPTAFGASSIYNQWLPIKYAGTYGTNGFYLPFTNTSTTSTLVADSSGNANNWTPNNISLTAGSTYDSLTDVPTLTSETVANYAVLNPLANGGGTLSNGNLTLTGPSGTWGTRFSTIGVTSGKWYFEVTTSGGSGSYGYMVGITQNSAPSSMIGFDANGYGYYDGGNKYNNNVGTAYGAAFTSGGLIGVAFDATAGTLTFYKDNASQGVAFSSLPSGTWFLGLSCYGTGGIAPINFGQQPFAYTPPSGFLPLNTFNIAAGTVTTSGTFTGNASTDGPMVYLNGTPTAMTINGNAVTFGTQADKLANGFKVRSSSASYNTAGSNTYVATTVGAVFKYEDAQGNP